VVETKLGPLLVLKYWTLGQKIEVLHTILTLEISC